VLEAKPLPQPAAKQQQQKQRSKVSANARMDLVRGLPLNGKMQSQRAKATRPKQVR